MVMLFMARCNNHFGGAYGFCDTCGGYCPAIPEPTYVWVLRHWPDIIGIYSTEEKAKQAQAATDYSWEIEKHEIDR